MNKTEYLLELMSNYRNHGHRNELTAEQWAENLYWSDQSDADIMCLVGERDDNETVIDALRAENERLRIEVDLQYEHIGELEEQLRWHTYPQEKPEVEGMYQITSINNEVYSGFYWMPDMGTNRISWDRFVIAYRPMPEAYKPEVEK